MLRLTTDGHKASSGFTAIAELLVLCCCRCINFLMKSGRQRQSRLRVATDACSTPSESARSVCFSGNCLLLPKAYGCPTPMRAECNGYTRWLAIIKRSCSERRAAVCGGSSMRSGVTASALHHWSIFTLRQPAPL